MTIPKAVSNCLASVGISIAVTTAEIEGSFSLLVPGDRAVEAWRAVRWIASETGLWPIIGGPPPAPHTAAQLEALARWGAPKPAPRWTGADRTRTLDAARALTPQALFAKWKVEVNTLPIGTRPVEIPSAAELGGAVGWLSRTLGVSLGRKTTPFVSPWNTATAAFHERVTLDLYPTDSPWEVPALTGYGGWNQCPLPEEHVVMLQSWHERFGADLVAIAGDRLEVVVSRAPATPDLARALAAEQIGYCGDLLQGFPSIDALADALPDLACWSFWWD